MFIVQANAGSTDRLIRIVLGLVLIGAFFFLASPWSYVALVAVIVSLATGVLRFCGLYRLLGINTCTAH